MEENRTEMCGAQMEEHRIGLWECFAFEKGIPIEKREEIYSEVMRSTLW